MKLNYIIIFLLFFTSVAFSQNRNQLSYQGRVSQDGKPYTGKANIIFAIGNVWTEQQDIDIRNGIYSVTLGKITPIPTSVFKSTGLSLKITFNGKTLVPDVPFYPVPYSYMALSVDKDAIEGYMIKDRAIESKHLANGTIKTTNLEANSINTTIIADKSILPADLKPEGKNKVMIVDANGDANWANQNIFTSANNTLTQGKIWIGNADNLRQEITFQGDIAMDNLGFVTINAGAVTSEKIKDNAILTQDLADNLINSAKIIDGSVATSDIASGGNDKVLTTNTAGQVNWIDKSTFISAGGSNFVKTDGTTPLSANWNVGNVQLNNLIDPTLAKDASTKIYVDNFVTAAFTSANLANNFVRLDGSTPLTANWDLGNFGLNNLQFASVNGNLLANDITSNSGIKIGISPNTVDGTLQFNTGAFYGYTGGTWNKFVTSNVDFTSAILQNGNAFATAISIGTNDNQNLFFRSNNNEFMNLTPKGSLYLKDIVGSNVFIGNNVGQANTSGNNNAIIGNVAGISNQTGSNNVFMGTDAGRLNIIGSNNVSLGSASGYTNNNSGNVFVGFWAGLQNNNLGNVMIGSTAGQLNSTGYNNVFLGYGAGANELGSEKLYIANTATTTPLIYGDFANKFMSVNGNLAIGYNNIPATAGDGMLAFNTGAFYGYSNGNWNKFVTSNVDFTSAILQKGNAFATAMEIGTKDTNPLIFKTNNNPVVAISASGQLGIGIMPQSELHVDKVLGNTNIRITGNSNLQNQGIQMGLTNQGYFVGRESVAGNEKFSINYESPYGVVQNRILTYDATSQSLGIGKPNPNLALLDINGNAHINGFLTVNNAIGIGYNPGGNNGMLRFNTAGYYEGYANGTWNKFVTSNIDFTSAILQKGNAFATAMEIGTNDNNSLIFKVNNTPFMSVSNYGGLYLNASNTPNSIYIGEQAGQSASGAGANTFVGVQAGKLNGAGEGNTFMGYLAGRNNTIGQFNVQIGNQAGISFNNGQGNVFLGSGAGRFSGGSANVYIGRDVATTNPSNNNVIIGNFAGNSSTGANNIFLGYSSGFNETGSNKLYIENSSANTPLIYGDFAQDFVSVNGTLAIGFSTATAGNGMLAFQTGNFYGYSNGTWNKFVTSNIDFTSAILQKGNAFATAMEIGTKDNNALIFKVNNTPFMSVSNYGGLFLKSNNSPNSLYIGNGSGQNTSNITGGNTFLGNLSGISNNTGFHNVFVGTATGYSNTSGIYNVFLGGSTGYTNITGSQNTFLGHNAGFFNNAGSNNVFIGFQAALNETSSNKLYIENTDSSSPLIIGDFATDRVGFNTVSAALFQTVTINGAIQIGTANTGTNGTIQFNTGNFYGYSNGNWNKFVTSNIDFTSAILQGGNNFMTALEIGTLNNAPIIFKANGQYAGRIAQNTGGNTFIGLNAGRNNAGLNNTALGVETFYNSTAGSYNVALGDQALYNNLANGNIGVGVNSLQSNQIGTNNVAMGYQAMMNTGTNVSNNVAIGYQAGVINAANDNTFIGYWAGKDNTSGSLNTFIGNAAGATNGTGGGNVLIGHSAGGLLTNHINQVAIGFTAGESNTGTGNISIGYGAGKSTTGGSNIIIGLNAGNNPSAGSENVFIGELSGQYATGNQNVFIGKEVAANGAGVTGGLQNVFIGYKAGFNNTTGANTNTFVGFSAGQANTTAWDNAFFGANAGKTNTTGGWNTFIGASAAENNTTGANNVFVGMWAGRNNSTGNDNTYVGSNAGHLSTGTGNIFLGNNAGYNETGSNKLYIANSNTATPLIFGDFGNKLVRINGTNLELITAFVAGNPDGVFQQGEANIFFSNGTNDARLWLDGNGQVYLSSIGGTGAIGNGGTQISDRRLKENISGLKSVLPKIMQLNGYRYNLIGQKETEIGVIAQEIEAQFPEITGKVEKNGKEYVGVKYDRLTAVLIEAIKEQQAQIEALKLEKVGLKSELDSQNAKIGNLEKQMSQILELLGKPKNETENGKK